MMDRWIARKIVLLMHTLGLIMWGSCSKFGEILPSGIGGDSVMDI